MNTLIIALYIATCAISPDVTNARGMFLGTYKNAGNARKFFNHTHAQKPANNTLLGYKGVSEIMMCEHVWSPISKLGYFNRGKELLESAIFAEKENVELRYLRFTIQTNVPKILGYARNIEEDKKVLMGYVQHPDRCGADNELCGMVRAYLLKCPFVNENEKAAIRQLYAGVQ